MTAAIGFTYVDAQFEHPITKKRTKWIRCQVSDIGERIVAPARGSNCFTSIQRYKDAVGPKTGGVPQDDPSGADMDEKARLARMREADELPGDKQVHHHGLFFDFDCDHKKHKIERSEAITRVARDVVKLVSWFYQALEIPKELIQIWFSGSKGFHVIVRPEPFGIEPHRHLTYIVKNVALHLEKTLELEYLDTSVYSISRLWRIANTVHPATGKYKIELTLGEVEKWGADEIMRVAAAPRNDTGTRLIMPESFIYDDVEYKDRAPEDHLRRWWRSFLDQYNSYQENKNVRPRRRIERPEGEDSFPVCVKDIMNNGPKDAVHTRNRVTMPLVGFFHDAGFSKEVTEQQIYDWTERWYPAEGELRERKANALTVINSAYSGNVSFACQFIRSLKGVGPNGHVACVGAKDCSWIRDPSDQEPEMIPTVHLSDGTKGVYIGTKIRTPVHVAAIAGHPFDLPMKGRIKCVPDLEAKICNGCTKGTNHNPAADLEWVLSADEELILSMINVNENMRKGAVKRHCGIPAKCFRHEMEVTEHSNVEELQIIPMVDYAKVYADEQADKDDVSQKWAQHVVRRAFHLGHGIKDNCKYMMEASVFAFPKDQRVCFLSDKFEPAQNDIDEFEMTEDLYQELLVFQPKPGQSVTDKIIEIHKDLTINITQIEGRSDLSIGVDLCYHAVIGFKFEGKVITKGWFELLVVGDSGTGKTTLTERLMQHYGLGEIIAGEGAKKTGLVTAAIQVQGQWVNKWGKIPQSDRRLLVIDEFGAIPGEEVGKMTQLRSEGKARGEGVNVGHETHARTRLILLSNPRNNRGKLAGFNYGIQAIEDLFDEAQDLRRVDLGMVAERSEVKRSALNRRWDSSEVPHKYTSDLCRNLILWAWSREPHHVEWLEGAEAAVLKWADKLGEVYDCDIPLAEQSDLKHKIARISGAVAARMFSTDSDAKRLYISIDHVDFAAKLMDRSYRKRAMAYYTYAKKYKNDNHFTADRRRIIKETLEQYEDYQDLVKTLLDASLITKVVFADMVNLGRNDLDALWKFLVSGRLFRKTNRGYRKTPAFTTYLQMLEEELNSDSNVQSVFDLKEDIGEVRDEKPERKLHVVTDDEEEEAFASGSKDYDYDGEEPPF